MMNGFVMNWSIMMNGLVMNWSIMMNGFVMNWSSVMNRFVMNWSIVMGCFMMDWGSVMGRFVMNRFVVSSHMMINGLMMIFVVSNITMIFVVNLRMFSMVLSSSLVSLLVMSLDSFVLNDGDRHLMVVFVMSFSVMLSLVMNWFVMYFMVNGNLMNSLVDDSLVMNWCIVGVRLVMDGFVMSFNVVDRFVMSLNVMRCFMMDNCLMVLLISHEFLEQRLGNFDIFCMASLMMRSLFVLNWLIHVSNLRLVLSVLLLRNLDISGSLLGVVRLFSIVGLSVHWLRVMWLLNIAGLFNVAGSVVGLSVSVVWLRIHWLSIVLCLMRRSIWLIWHVVVAVFWRRIIGRCSGGKNGENAER